MATYLDRILEHHRAVAAADRRPLATLLDEAAAMPVARRFAAALRHDATSGLPVRVLQRTVIFGAYDNIIARFPGPGRLLRGLLQALEKTPLRGLGLSHYWVIEKADR